MKKKKYRLYGKKKKVTFAQSVAKYFKDFGTAVSKGDKAVKLSLILMGAGFFARKQLMKGIIISAVQLMYLILLIFWAIPNLADFGTLGTVQLQMVFDPATGKNIVNDYDNSFLILISSITALFTLFVFIFWYIHNIKEVYKLQLREEQGKYINNFFDELQTYKGSNFHRTLLTLPTLGIILMNILPLFVLVAVAFTNYDKDHMPPNSLLSWVGLKTSRRCSPAAECL